MPDKTSPSALELSEEVSQALARGRELARRAQPTADGAGQQAGQAKATMAETDRILDEAQQLIDEIAPK